jgi:hypothetical protein
MINIIAVKTKKGYYLTDGTNNSYSVPKLKNTYINGELSIPTFHKNWFFVPDEIKMVQQKQSQPSINYRYELIDPTMESDKIPLRLEKDVATYEDNFDYETCWYDDYKHLASLYRLKYDIQPEILVDVEYNFEILLELDDIQEFNGFAYPVPKTQYKSDGLINITEKDVRYQLLDQILFPDIVLPSRPCEMTSEQMYKIVRQYIKENINLKYSRITSDYEFCFTVEKVIGLAEPYTSKYEITKSNGKSYRPPKYNTNYVKNRTIKVFEMTYSPKNYQGYTPISSMIGENADDLKEKIDRYCKEIIDEINKPLVDCPHCKGQGVIFEK